MSQQQHTISGKERTRLFSSTTDTSSVTESSSSRGVKVQRLSPEAHYSQTDVTRIILEFAATSAPAIGTLRLVCRHWNGLLRVDFETLDLWRRAVKNGTLGRNSSQAKANRFFEDDLDAEYILDNAYDITDDLWDEIRQHGFFENRWTMFFKPESASAHIPVLYTQLEHADFFSSLQTISEVKKMHGVISGLFQLSRFIKENNVLLQSDQESEYQPFLLKWDPTLQFSCSRELLEAFRKHIGWRLPLRGDADFVEDAIIKYNKELNGPGQHDEEGHTATMYRRLADLALRLGTNEVQEERKGAADGVGDDDNARDTAEDQKRKDLRTSMPIYSLNYGVDAMATFPRFFVSRSLDGKYLLGLMGIITWS